MTGPSRRKATARITTTSGSRLSALLGSTSQLTPQPKRSGRQRAPTSSPKPRSSGSTSGNEQLRLEGLTQTSKQRETHVVSLGLDIRIATGAAGRRDHRG